MQLNLDNIIDVHKKISNNVKWTETSFSNSISEKLGVDIFFKFENRQFTGAFKVRGSYSKLLSLTEHEKKIRCCGHVRWKSCSRFSFYF